MPGSVSKVLAVQTGRHNSVPSTQIQSRHGGSLSVRDPVSKTRWRAIENCVRLFAGSGWEQKKIILSQTKSDSEGQIYVFFSIYLQDSI